MPYGKDSTSLSHLEDAKIDLK